MNIEIDLTRIDPNPWQTRLTEDPEHIKKIANSILTQGLMQVPVGRLIHDTGGIPLKDMRAPQWPENVLEMKLHEGNAFRVQLAFGHSRLAAFKLLAVEDPRWNEMPVIIQDLTDEQMFTQGLQENLARKDLTPFEEARAMRRYRDEFGKRSNEIGFMFGLADSTVRNKMRLLDLPEDIQTRAAGLSEEILRGLLSIYDLPEIVRANGEKSWPKLSETIEEALQGELPPEMISRRIEQVFSNVGLEMSKAPWKQDKALATDQPGKSRACKGCEYRFQRNNKVYCTQRACYNAHLADFQAGYLNEAARVCSIPVGDEKLLTAQSWDHDYTSFQYMGQTETLEKIMAANCSNLRLKYDDSTHHKEQHDHVDGFPHAQIVCQKRAGFCACSQALKTQGSGVAIEDASIETSETSEAPAETQLTEQRLKEIAAATRRQKRANLEVVRRMEDQAIQNLAVVALDSSEFWLTLLRRVQSYQAEEAARGSSLQSIRTEVYRALLRYQAVDPDNSSDASERPDKCEDRYNEFLEKLGAAPLPWSIKVEEVKA